MRQLEDVHDLATGRWRGILARFGVPERILNGKHHPCPLCGGTDRFRFTDREARGTYICNQCGHGTGVDLVMRLKGLEFSAAAREIKALVGHVPVQMPRATERRYEPAAYVAEVWAATSRFAERDPAWTYLVRRGIHPDRLAGITQLRLHPRLKHASEGRPSTHHPAMVAQIVSPDASRRSFHATYLSLDGRKASVEPPRKYAPGGLPKGGAVRLCPSAETMGIAEGIETALSAAQLFDVPVWAACDKQRLMEWEPPPTVKCVLVFGDNDSSFAGQAAAYALANRLTANKSRGLHVEARIPETVNTDWNDVLTSLQR